MLGRYALLKRLARGGMGEVFLGSTTGLEGAERPVVVKIIRREHASDPSFIARFLDEARVQAQLVHSGVAQVIEAASDETTGEPYAVVEYVEGKSLGDVRARALQVGHRLVWSEAVSLATMIADALAHVHERKDAAGRPLSIVHRDLSPQNVMVSFQGEVKIIDFGTARGQNRRCRTVSGVVFAKPGYVAPEVANGDTGDARVDLYALGIMLWELCAGRRFLQGDAGIHMANVARNQCSPAPVAESLGAPLELDAIIAKLTAFERDERYSEARVAARDLAKLLSSSGALTNGERGVRARTSHLMQALFPSEPERTRREFAKLVVASLPMRKKALAQAARPEPADTQPKASQAERPATDERKKEPADPNLMPGTRYRLIREIGRGASSVVHEAEHVDLMRRVALKVLTAEHTRVPEYAARFRREARALSQLSHEHLVQIVDFGVAADGRLFCVMELLEGETLEARLEREKTLGWTAAFEVGRKALRALEAAHAAGVIHRDIKPANLFLTANGGLKLLDFGLAKAISDGPAKAQAEPSKEAAEKGSDELTKNPGFTLLGTPEYMAPEQASSGQVDARSDVYAVGAVLYEMISGGLPFTGPSPVAILASKIKGMPEKPSERCPAAGLSRSVDDVVMNALSRHPSLRFQSAREMRLAMEKAMAEPVVSRARRRVLALSAIAMAMAFAGVLLAGKSSEIRAVAAKLWQPRAQIEAEASPADVKEEHEQPASDVVAVDDKSAEARPEQPSSPDIQADGNTPEPEAHPAPQEGAVPEAPSAAALAMNAPNVPEVPAAPPPPKHRPRQHKKIAAPAVEAKLAASKVKGGNTLKQANSGEKALTPPKNKVASLMSGDPGHGGEPGSAAKDNSKPLDERTARKEGPNKPSRKHLPPGQRKKKTRIAKKEQ